MSEKVDKDAFERARASLEAKRSRAAVEAAFEAGDVRFANIDAGCQASGCSRRSRVVVFTIESVSFLCNKHAAQLESALMAGKGGDA